MTSNNTPPGAAGLGIWGHLGIWIALGACFGLLVGGFFDNTGLGISLGMSLGVVIYVAFIARRNSDGES